MAAGTLVDANVLLDILTADAQWSAWSSAELRGAYAAGPLFVNPIICAEIAPAFDFEWPRMETWLAQAGIIRAPLPCAASTLAAAAHAQYRERGGTRERPLPDFFIGAHAEMARCTLLTRDASRYRSYFPTVPLISPA